MSQNSLNAECCSFVCQRLTVEVGEAQTEIEQRRRRLSHKLQTIVDCSKVCFLSLRGFCSVFVRSLFFPLECERSWLAAQRVVEQPLNTCHADGKMLHSSRPLKEESKSAPLPSILESFCLNALSQAVPWLPGRRLSLFFNCTLAPNT